MVNHLIVDFLCKENGKIDNKQFIVNFVKDLVRVIGMKILKGPFIVKGTKRPGYSCFAIIEESHVSIHTFLDTNTANIDVFSCRDFDEKTVIDYIKKKTKAKILKIYSLKREI